MVEDCHLRSSLRRSIRRCNRDLTLSWKTEHVDESYINRIVSGIDIPYAYLISFQHVQVSASAVDIRVPGYQLCNGK